MEGNEILHFAHIDTIAIGVPDLWGTGEDDNFFRVESGGDAYDTISECGSSYDGVVYQNEGVDIILNDSVGYIVDEADHAVSGFFIRDKGSLFFVFVD